MLTRFLLQRCAKGGDRLVEPRRAALSLAESPEHITEVRLRLGPVERGVRPRIFRQRAPKDLDRTTQRVVVPALVALPVESVGLTQKIAAFLVGMSARYIFRGLAEKLRCLPVTTFGHRHVALGGGRLRCAEHLRVFRRLSL